MCGQVVRGRSRPARPTAAIDVARAALHAGRPAGVRAEAWAGLFEFVAWKLALLVGLAGALPFVHELCHPGRFAALELSS